MDLTIGLNGDIGITAALQRRRSGLQRTIFARDFDAITVAYFAASLKR